ncbi:prenyltransferase/squalene oxidase repeat-containing protein [Kutzneria sp. CA-103260]|uniref:prenyltransferase/squalene oxidase repeat-containing protein n=1 Tax=Kutzneria sp. CA-103260 TaxID=2802641 RepID=UPI001BAA3B2B|nr:prenyltransferase/squalene oxidase repeat-containing protein [Kutzneria sp. CA-103260]QUQ65522.1 Type B diterpene cyclase [Kutzneria sp. CA-103260]
MRLPEAVRRVRQYLPEPKVTRISPSAYDTAMVATLRTPDGSEPLLPSTLDWLRANQHPDGSWGATVFAPYDRFVCTLAAAVALAELARDHPADVPDVAGTIERGMRFLRQAAPTLKPGDPHETIGFELIVPTLLSQAGDLGLRPPVDQLAWVADEHANKMAKVPAKAFNRITTLLHSLEAFGDRWPSSALPGLQAPDGSFGLSPAATAAAHRVLPQPGTMDYFDTALRATGTGAMPTVYPYRTFDDAWTFNAYLLCGAPVDELRPHVGRLAAAITDRGIGPDAGLPPDADDTGVVLPVLAHCGYPVDLDVLSAFETPSGYATFELERGISVSTNVHVLGALALDRTGLARQIDIVLDLLRSTRLSDAYWVDKWHLSPLYPTGHAVPVLHGLDEQLCGAAVDWILATQHDNGGWGLGDGTLEETGYALLALLAVVSGHPHVEPALHRGMRFVHEHWSGVDDVHPELWIGKVLYTPYRVVDATLAAVCFWYARTHPDR